MRANTRFLCMCEEMKKKKTPLWNIFRQWHYCTLTIVMERSEGLHVELKLEEDHRTSKKRFACTGGNGRDEKRFVKSGIKQNCSESFTERGKSMPNLNLIDVKLGISKLGRDSVSYMYVDLLVL